MKNKITFRPSNFEDTAMIVRRLKLLGKDGEYSVASRHITAILNQSECQEIVEEIKDSSSVIWHWSKQNTYSA